MRAQIMQPNNRNQVFLPIYSSFVICYLVRGDKPFTNLAFLYLIFT